MLLIGRSRAPLSENIGTFSPSTETFQGEQEAQRIGDAASPRHCFHRYCLSPHLGRLILPEEDKRGSRPVAILSDGFWRRAFGADPRVVEKSILLGGRSYTIIGVMPPEVHFPSKAITPGWGFLSGEADVFVPHYSPQGVLGAAHTQLVIGRLKPGVSAPAADAEMKLIAKRLEDTLPDTNRGWGATVAPMIEQVVREARGALWIFAGAVTFVLLIACARM